MASDDILSRIYEAVVNNNVKEIVDLYKSDSIWQQINPSSSYEIDNGYVILLHLACSHGQLEIIQFFCNSPLCDVNCQDNKQRNALHQLIRHNYNYTSSYKRVSAAKILLEKGCNIYAQDRHGNTPIHMAVYFHDLNMLTTLIANQSNNIRVVADKNGNTPLHVACITGLSKETRNEIISVLLEFCPKCLFYTNKNGYSPLFLACYANHSFFLEKLTPYYNYNLHQRSKFNCSNLLHVAVRANKVCNVKWLMSQHDFHWFEYSVNISGETPLHLVKSTECVKALLSGGFNLNIQDSNGNTLLHSILLNLHHSFSINEQLQLIAFLLQLKECDINILNEKLYTPLHIAVKRKLCRVVELFLSASSCKVMAPDKEGRSILHMAVESKCLPMIERLLNHDRVDTSFADYAMDTPLHLAAISLPKELLGCFKDFTSNFNQEGKNALHLLVSHRDLDTLKQVISTAEPDIAIPTREGDTVLHLAAKHGDVEILSFLAGLKVLDINCMNFNLNTCLHVAVKESQHKVVEWLLMQRDCDFNLPNIHGLSPLMVALYDRNFDILCTATSAGIADISLIRTRNNNTCLHLAVQSNNMSMITFFLKFVDVNLVNSNLETPFFIAARYSHISIVKMLGSINECNINARNADGNSPLHIAVSQESAEVTQTLIDLHCDLDLKNNEGLMPLHLAVKGNQPSLDILLSLPRCDKLACTSSGNNILHLAALHDVRIIFKHRDFSLWKNAMINSRNSHLDTPLHIAVQLSHLEFIEQLLDTPGINVNVPNRDSLTPFHLAVLQSQKDVISCFVKAEDASCSGIREGALHLVVQEGKSEVLDFLLSLKVLNINGKNDHGKTPLHIAVSAGFVDITEKMCKLKQCDVTLPDEDGNTPLHLACALDRNDQASVHITEKLLQTGKVTPQCVNNEGKSPAELAKDNYSVLHQLSTFIHITTNNPLENFMKVFVMGNAEVGKSSLIEAICTEAKYSIYSRNKLVRNVSPLTAGIVPRTFCSKSFGHTVLYEFAGQPEFYAPHAAILENMVNPSPPVFVIVVSLMNSDDKILKDVCYWWNFISHQCKARKLKPGTYSPPHAIIALSYLDYFKKQGKKIDVLKDWLLKELDSQFPTINFEFGGKISALDCRKIVSKGLTHLQHFLNDSCRTLRIKCDVDFNCHYLIAFLKDNFYGHHAIQLKDIPEKLHHDSFITRDHDELVKLLSILHDQDLILLLKNEKVSSESWIILQKEELLSKVTGSIFCPPKFSQHCADLAYSTGVVPLSNIKKHFSNYNPEMLANLFSYLEFCSLITDPMAFKLIEDQYPLLTDEKYYFFPGLVRTSCPLEEKVWKSPNSGKYLKCGWYYEADKFELLSRFLQVLILRIAFSFALSTTQNFQSPFLNRRCSIWTNGIAWLRHGFQVIVEFGERKNWISVIIQCKDDSEIRVQCTCLLSKLTSLIRETKEEFCASLDMTEYFISPECVGYPISNAGDLVIYDLDDAVESILSGSESVTDKCGKVSISISRLVAFEPLLYCGRHLLSHIFSSNSSANFSDELKKSMEDDSRKHCEQLELIDTFFLLYRTSRIDCLLDTEPDIPFSKFILKCSLLSSKLICSVSCIATYV